jgi:hypothetical protein
VIDTLKTSSDLGNIIFRLEMNFEALKKRQPLPGEGFFDGSHVHNININREIHEIRSAITDDLETLKKIKRHVEYDGNEPQV